MLKHTQNKIHVTQSNVTQLLWFVLEVRTTLDLSIFGSGGGGGRGKGENCPPDNQNGDGAAENGDKKGKDKKRREGERNGERKERKERKGKERVALVRALYIY